MSTRSQLRFGTSDRDDAGCVYAAAGGHVAPVTQIGVGDVVGVTAPTLRQCWEELQAR